MQILRGAPIVLGLEIGIGYREKLGHEVASMKAPWGDLKLELSIRVVPN